MTTENKIKCVLMDFEINKITLQEATKQILLLLNVVGRSEQLVCEHKYQDNVCEHKYQDNVCDWRGVRKCIMCMQMEKGN